jgi:hypothetical protein
MTMKNIKKDSDAKTATKRELAQMDLLKEYRPPLETTDIYFVNDEVLEAAESLIAACERCAAYADLSFDYIIDELTGCDPTRTEYLLPRVARCRHCGNAISEKTLVATVN